MKWFFRPINLFPDNYVDLSIAFLILIFLVIIGLVALIEPIPTFSVAIGVGSGLLIGAAAVLFEIFWHRHEKHTNLALSYVPHTVNALLMPAAMLVNDEGKAAVCIAFLCYQMIRFASLWIAQSRTGKRYRWKDLFPKKIERKAGS